MVIYISQVGRKVWIRDMSCVRMTEKRPFLKCDVLMSSVSITHTFGKVMKDIGKNPQMQIIALLTN